MNSYRSEFEEILKELLPLIPKKIDGKDAIIKMKEEGSPNWRQMEWIGFWFEHFVKNVLKTGPSNASILKYGNTKFDLVRNFSWDLKVHPNQGKSLILNDLNAIEQCLLNEEGLGFIILMGDAEYDEASAFKNWHDNLKGGTSAYEKERIARRAPSRRRKVSFTPTSIEGFWFKSMSEIESGLAKGILGEFQSGMRNSNGVPRMPKLMIKKLNSLENYTIDKVELNNDRRT